MKQRGFTLIELIIVIIILGILAVTAAPRFFDFAGDARESSARGLQGALQGASQTVYARAAIDGELGTGGEVNGIATEYGYPAATAAGIVVAAQLNAFDAADDGASSAEWAFIEGTGQIRFTLGTLADPGAEETDGDIEDTNCWVLYEEATDANKPPEITSDLSGC